MRNTLLAACLAAAPAAALAQAAPDSNPDHVKAGIFQVEPSHTRILFAVSHMGFTTWYGDFTGATGTLTLDPAKLADASFTITIPANSVSTTNAKLDGELNGPKWFDTRG
jgi:polyisoprenoid-binding protein YceI